MSIKMLKVFEKLIARKRMMESRLAAAQSLETSDYPIGKALVNRGSCTAMEDEVAFLTELLEPKPKLKFRIEAEISSLTPGFPNDYISVKRWFETYFAVDENDLSAQAKENLYDEKGNPYTYTIIWFPYWFECEIRPVKNLKWWEENAIRVVQNHCLDHGRIGISIDELADAMYDAWDEDCFRDGEPGPKAGNVDFDANEVGYITIKSTRVLAVVRMVKGPGYVETENGDDDGEE